MSGTGVPGVDPLVYQYVNLTEVDIRGLEARADIYWDNGFSLVGSAAVDGFVVYSVAAGDAYLEAARAQSHVLAT